MRGPRALAAVALVALALVPWVAARHQLSLLTDLLIYGLFALSLDLIMGYTGMVSFGHAAYFGLGAYASALVLIHFALPIPVALLAGGFLPKVGEVAARHPRLKLIIDHLGRPSGTKDDAAWANLSEMLALARHENVAIKATGAPSYSSEPYPYRNIHGHLRRIYDAFGPSRMFWGTDITRMPCSWRRCVTMFTEELPWLTGRDLELVMGRAVCDWIDWKLPRA